MRRIVAERATRWGPGAAALRGKVGWAAALDEPLRVSESEMQAALQAGCTESCELALETAAEQHPDISASGRNLWSGNEYGRAGSWASWCVRSAPLDVTCPGGRYPLPSTLLMTVIPAQVAGVKDIRVVSPRPAQATLAAAALLGVREFYRVGGAQAIAALAYGTKKHSSSEQDRRAREICL